MSEKLTAVAAKFLDYMKDNPVIGAFLLFLIVSEIAEHYRDSKVTQILVACIERH